MKILLSAYACEPNKGSEPGVGWHWAIEIAKQGHEVWVLTRANNQSSIENFIKNQNFCFDNLKFVYFDLPEWIRVLKHGLEGVHWYYFLWQVGAFFTAKRLHTAVCFDTVHHITFVSARQPSFMGFLGIPFIFGPLAGGEVVPWPLRKNFPFHGQCRDLLRDAVNAYIFWDPLMNIAFHQADTIYTTSEETLKMLPAKYQQKAKVQLAIGAIVDETYNLDLNCQNKKVIRVLYVGNLLYWKGIHLGLKAFAQFQKTLPNSRLTIVGNGQDASWLKAMARMLSIDSSIDWVSKMPQSELSAYYASQDIFLFPSLRDSGGMVVLEALSHGLPVICLNLGGPSVTVDETCGIRVNAYNRTENQVVESLKQGLLAIAGQSPFEMKKMKLAAQARARQFTWERIVESLYPKAQVE